jgi:heavy metal sensor kinase
MRSVRVSLLVYFAVLLALALGAVSALVYGQAERSLEDRQQSIEELLKAKYEERRRLENEKLNDALLAEARNLAGLVQIQVRVPRMREETMGALGLLTVVLTPSAHCVSPLWVAEATPWNPIANRVRFLSFTPRLREMVLPRDPEGQVTRYFQINLRNGAEWRSRSMETWSFPFDPDAYNEARLVDWHFDDTELPPGQPVRRVTLQVARFPVLFDFPRKGPKGPRGRPKDGAQPPRAPPEWTIYIQGAAPTAARTEALARFRESLDQESAQRAAESDEARRTLQGRLLAVSLLTFAATLLGGLWLVWLGLRPVNRLSDAVSRVSAKDFRLPLDPRGLPEELRPIADRLAQTLDQLRHAFAREKQAAADISHELRTPLACLMASLDVALRKPRSAEEYRRVLEECRATGEQMGGLVERLLALARLDAESAHLRPREVDAADLAEQCAGLVRPLAEARGLTLSVTRNGPALLTTDPDKLREVLTNLLHNAVEYNRPEGRVEVAVEREDGRVRLHVRDTGIGIPQEAREHIFERFYRADPSRHAEGVHAGIGLAIVKGYVELLGGSVAVDSKVGEGTTFTVTLPAKE